jgi:hypothetical protein
MDKKAQNVALAEFAGWKDISVEDKMVDFMWAPGHISLAKANWQRGNRHSLDVPDYLASLDSIREIESLLFKSSRPFSSNPGDHEPDRYVHNLATVCGMKTREELVLHVPDNLYDELIARLQKGPPVTLPLGCTVLGHHIPCTGWELVMICATVEQRAEAILRTIGKWVETIS